MNTDENFFHKTENENLSQPIYEMFTDAPQVFEKLIN